MNLFVRKKSKTNIPEHKKSVSEKGFTLIEVMISLLILVVALLGVVAVFQFSIVSNTGNTSRAQALALLQQETEQLRSLKFTSTAMDARLAGGVKPPRTVVTPDGISFSISITVDDDPFTAGVQVNNNKTLKEITVTVNGTRVVGNDWRRGFATETVLRRVRGN